jgi:hypothetical protein
MAIRETTVVDQITVTENGVILYRDCNTIIEDGVELILSLTIDHTIALRSRPDWTTSAQSGCHLQATVMDG